MNIITLNTWAGRSMHPLMRFLKRRAETTDVFCLQEVLNTSQAMVDTKHPDEFLCADLFTKIKSTLQNFSGYFAEFEDDPDRQSLAIFVKETLTVEEVGDIIIYEPDDPIEHGSHVISSRKLQHVTLKTPKGALTIFNYHGLWTGGSKKDTPERLEQSRRIREKISEAQGSMILAGDFNLLPDTKSMEILCAGLRNLITEFHITSTRNELYRHYHNTDEENYADYVLISPDINVKNFTVLEDLVSDHAALLLEIA